MRESLTYQLAAAGLSVDTGQANALLMYLDEIRRWNRVHNLTAITELSAMIQRHVVESLALRRYLKGRRIADIGSGAGLPGIPLAIAEPHRRFTLIESRGKRAAFLRHVQGLLGLENVAVEHCRVEAISGAPAFDTLLARAVAPPEEVLRLAAGLFGDDTVLIMPVGGRFASGALPGDARFEVCRAEGAAERLGGTLLVARRRR